MNSHALNIAGMAYSRSTVACVGASLYWNGILLTFRSSLQAYMLMAPLVSAEKCRGATDPHATANLHHGRFVCVTRPRALEPQIDIVAMRCPAGELLEQPLEIALRCSDLSCKRNGQRILDALLHQRNRGFQHARLVQGSELSVGITRRRTGRGSAMEYVPRRRLGQRRAMMGAHDFQRHVGARQASAARDTVAAQAERLARYIDAREKLGKARLVLVVDADGGAFEQSCNPNTNGPVSSPPSTAPRVLQSRSHLKNGRL